MSGVAYAVVVVGGNPGQQLKKFDGNRPTPPRFEAMDQVEYATWVQLSYACGYFDSPDPDPHEVLKMLQDEAGEQFKDHVVIGGKLGRMATHNPHSRFSGLENNGFFDGYFLTKTGKRTARLAVRELDLEAMREDRRRQAEIRYREFTEAVLGLRPPRDVVTQAQREMQRGLTFANAIESAKRRWWDNSWTRAALSYDWSPDISEPWRGKGDTGVIGELLLDGHPWHTFCMDYPDPQAEFVRRKVLRAGVPMAYVDRGQWHGWGEQLPGEDDERDPTEVWAEQVMQLYEGLEPSARLTASLVTF